MKSKKAVRIVAATLSVVIASGTFMALAACGNKKTDTLIIMSEELNGLYNPFYSTAGTDMDVVGQTQISMLASDSEGGVACGKDEAVAVLDYEVITTGTGDNAVSEYYFVLKNGLQFSDGTPLTMNDVLFNMYVYLDPTYAGSTTMYSTNIQGLQTYRSQSYQPDNGDSSQADEQLDNSARTRATNRRRELTDIFKEFNEGTSESPSYEASIEDMRGAIAARTPSSSYMSAIAPHGDISVEEARAQLLADYNYFVGEKTTLKNNKPSFADDVTERGRFYNELLSDYNTARSAYLEEPYKSSPVPFDEILSFMYMEGYATIDYNRGADGTYDKNSIKDVVRNYSGITTMEEAIAYVWSDKVNTAFDQIVEYWVSGSDALNEYISRAKDVCLHEELGEDDTLPYPNITGIRSLGHMPAGETLASNKITVNGTEYTIATEHKDDGTPKNPGEHDVLRIRVNGIDPKAIWNFGFSIAPYHYYSDPDKYPMNIEKNQFGVEWASFDFQTNVLQGTTSAKFGGGGVSKNRVPMGAGPYVATNERNEDYPGANEFFSNNFVYYKANEYFFANVAASEKTESLHPALIKKMRYQVVSSYNALAQLESGAVHFVEPQFTDENSKQIERMKSKGFDSVDSWNLGYGYIGINAGKIKKLNLRKAIMAAMDTTLALDYYQSGTVCNIYWPMSLVSWAYPRSSGQEFDPNNPTAGAVTNNGHDYTMFPNYGNSEAQNAREDEEAKARILTYMNDGGYSQSDLKVTFTIAGSNLTEHPCYAVFKHAMDLLNACGWQVEVIPDTNALTKLATGSLAVWAAAWGSTIDPDMYQVYHKNSTATSVYAWGYREIKAQPGLYPQETTTLNALSDLIDNAREIDSSTAEGKTRRADLYRQAMNKVLDLAVELPVYQRKMLYAFNTKVIDRSTFPKDESGNILINAYSSPLSRIWELDFVH